MVGDNFKNPNWSKCRCRAQYQLIVHARLVPYDFKRQRRVLGSPSWTKLCCRGMNRLQGGRFWYGVCNFPSTALSGVCSYQGKARKLSHSLSLLWGLSASYFFNTPLRNSSVRGGAIRFFIAYFEFHTGKLYVTISTKSLKCCGSTIQFLYWRRKDILEKKHRGRTGTFWVKLGTIEYSSALVKCVWGGVSIASLWLPLLVHLLIPPPAGSAAPKSNS